ncbi:MAG: biopolymer transporter ExbD [Pseudomonadota bacterium]
MAHTASTPPSLASRPRKRLRISLTPLIDVVFILLVFFMLASSFLDWRSIELTSAGRPGGAPGVEGALLVELTPEGPRLSGERLNLASLGARLTSRVATKPDQRVLIRPVAGVDMQRMVTLLDTIAAAGITDIALMPGGG